MKRLSSKRQSICYSFGLHFLVSHYYWPTRGWSLSLEWIFILFPLSSTYFLVLLLLLGISLPLLQQNNLLPLIKWIHTCSVSITTTLPPNDSLLLYKTISISCELLFGARPIVGDYCWCFCSRALWLRVYCRIVWSGGATSQAVQWW